MARVIKFRAYTKNHWINSGMLYDYQDTTYLESCGWDEFPIMQFTGLKDKNGKDIYEGDIVETRDEGDIIIVKDYNEFIYTVLYSEYHSGLNGYTQTDLKIIGNIYENPELLEQ